MSRLLVVHHSPTPSVQRLTDAVLAGARDDEIEGVDVVVRAALEAHADDVLGADGVLLGTTANFRVVGLQKALSGGSQILVAHGGNGHRPQGG